MSNDMLRGMMSSEPASPSLANLRRYRADRLALKLWSLEHGALSWAPASPRARPNPASRDRIVTQPDPPGYLTIYLDDLPRLGIEGHVCRLWRSDYERVLGELRAEEREALERYLRLSFDHKGRPRAYHLYYSTPRGFRPNWDRPPEPEVLAAVDVLVDNLEVVHT